MITSLTVRNFTVFPTANLTFGKHLNVFVGVNGTGKSHLLKLAYSLLAVGSQGLRASNQPKPERDYLKTAVASKLVGVFRPDELGRLARRTSAGVQRCEVSLSATDPAWELSLTFNTRAKTEVEISKVPAAWIDKAPVFLPTRELLTIYPGFVSLYETTALPFEETWRDTCVLLGAPLAKGPRLASIRGLLQPLEQALGGNVAEDGGHFYLFRGAVRTEAHLVAEGLRKVAMLARLISTGSLVDKGFLFWDEPEANLNPLLIKEIARVIVELSAVGIQVFVATHSLFLLRELHILQLERAAGSQLDTRCFGLQLDSNGAVSIIAGSTMDDIGSLAVLDEDLLQSERYLLAEGAKDQ